MDTNIPPPRGEAFNTLSEGQNMEFEYVFRPIEAGGLRIKNRLEVSPAEPFLCTREGAITDEFIAFTSKLAAGGAGIVTVGDSPVTQAYADSNHFVVNLADEYIVHGLVKVSEAIRRYGAAASIELNLRDPRKPAELSREEIRGIINSFALAAERCRKAGFDMLMLHFGHGHTAASFFSPDMNKRTDEYGCGSFEDRCRFANELLDAVREKTGGMPIEMRFSGDELYPGGVHADEGIEFVKAIQDKIDLIHISAGSMHAVQTMEYTIQHTYMPRATNADIAALYKAAGLKIPVVSVGSYDMELAEKALRENKADMIAMIRAFIADPGQIKKARAGKSDEIRPCIRCNVCTGDDPHGCPKPLRCTVNAEAGRETMFLTQSAPEAKKAVVIGGGCAGMEAARRAAERGCSVVLFEKESELGGSLRLAGANPIKSDVRRYAEWSVRMTERTPGIDIRTGTEATEELVLAEKPDAVIVAVGSEQIRPRIPGGDDERICFAWQLDTGEVKAGERVVIAGAGLTGSETAVMLAREGKQVVLIDRLPLEEIMLRDKNVARVHRMALSRGVRIMDRTSLAAMTAEGAVVTDAGGKETVLPCDTLALSLGVRRRTELAERFEKMCDRVYFAGDCANRQGNITTAVRDGFFAAMNL
jgi:2,4-dienoyl-CoA reductase-like NADH-dependent reductase (Old Yellow Enzyme family)/thioredoxin reductase